MAGIEQLEVHSKSYVLRWVKVEDGNTLSWSVQPHKKSINFGIVKHPGSGATTLAASTGDSFDGAEETRGVAEGKSSRFSKKEITAQDLLKSKGFIPIKWTGKCEADKVSMGTYEVPQGQSGMYGLVFDNTFSKQTSKTATFVVLTYPTGSAPHTSSHLPNLQAPKAGSSQISLGRHSAANLDGVASASFDSLHSHKAGGKATSVSGRSDGGNPSNYHVGNLHKRRRKKGQGYARRFFSLDYSTCTLSYYYNPKSSALRGAIPLSLAAIAADQRRREISIDSGAEVWHLKAPNDKEFQEWARALERASRVARGLEALDLPAPTGLRVNTHIPPIQQSSAQENREWEQVEALVSRVVGTRDALRRLTKEVTAQSKPTISPKYLTPGSGAIEEEDTYFTAAPERKSFWRRKSGTPLTMTPTGAVQASTAAALAVPSPGSVTTTISASSSRTARRRSRGNSIQEENSLQDHCQSLLADLDSVVAEFTTVISNSKRRRLPMSASAGGPRRSMESVSTADEFFDAEDANSGVLQLDKIDASEEEIPGSDDNEASFQDNSSISSIEEDEKVDMNDTNQLFPSKPKNLAPLPYDKPVTRRTTIAPATVSPPSLIAFVRKNVGKDLSTISMPVSANEPTSLVQKVAEQLEYGQLLSQAAKQSSPTDRLLFVAAFAISQFSSGRAKERAMRKPFNPLLGETFELVRSEKEVPGGFRLIVEKVQHRPVVLAMQADSTSWSFSQSASPGQKFWGKSAEITTDGRVRIVLRLSNGQEERYSWNIATMFLRNVVMGEKYVEPVGTMHVVNDSTGHKAAVEFKSKGMFGGRAEDVIVEIFNPEGVNTGSGLTGTWTSGLKTSGKGGGQEIWRVGTLVENAAQTYGFTSFAATLNEITEIDQGKLPPTDCRLRPDQRLAEQGKLDEAEEWKHGLEEAQRARRRDLEERGEMYRPRWFVKAENCPEGEEVWKLKSGKEGYWEERAKGSWQGVEDIFALPEAE
ncbi:Oxysterol-binding protein-domain-containing protein [Dactylonectria macrodidyma]|uniref:Oxysterol-binding protein-domain-containing protein n=1 Tax=Dactylonectria macrodidyma TaxID=307937 RepID=A0A9P9J562_9HYPO|nr:Oxysterol-binding protein-domain-containing protein [Dactylonectria macrodidyma]